MPTGNTYELDEKNLDTKTWIMKHLARSFCICVMMRDDGNLTENQIINRMKQDTKPSEHHVKKLRDAKRDLKKFQSLTDEQWKSKMKRENKKRQKHTEESNVKSDKIKVKHDKTREELNKILNTKGISSITRNIVKFGIDQLNLCKSEEENTFFPKYDELFTDVEVYKKEELSNAKRDVQYHQKEIQDEIKRGKERLKLYLQLRKDINRILK